MLSTLPSDIKKLNRQLESHFGVDTESMRQMWRVVWSDDQYEKRRTKFTETGIELLYEIVLELPKYQHAKHRWILENLVAVPEENLRELVDAKTSYECVWAFPEKVVPSFEACKFLFDLMQAAKGRGSMFKYVDPDSENPIEKRNAQIDKLVEELYGDESSLMLTTVTGESVAYTGPPKI